MTSISFELIGSRPKRQKISLACSVCRQAKTKCDGARPVCSPCLKRRNGAQQCAYHAPNRLSMSTPNHPPMSTPNRPSMSTPVVDSALSRIRDESLPRATREAPNSQRPSSPASSHNSDSTDAMGAVDGWALKAGLLGASSATNFMRQMRKAVDGRETCNYGSQGATSSHVTHVPGRLSSRVHEWKRNLHGSEYVLPPRATADALLYIYWEYVWTIFPFVDEAEVSRCYENMWLGNCTQSFNQKTFHCILNLAFALACKLDPKAAHRERESSASIYFTRARGLLSFDLLELSDVHLVQALLLLCQYLQSTKMPRECFQTVGLAVWIAMDLGLHLPATARALQDSPQRGIARRVWQGCITMDRITAMTFGRPMRLAQETLPKLPPPPMEMLTSPPSKLRFFEDYYQLHIILGDVLESFYTRAPYKRNRPEMQTQMLEHLIKLDQKLTNWYDDLTPYLKLPVPSEGVAHCAIYERQANNLYARWLHIRMLLWRPFFSTPLSFQDGGLSVSSALAEFTTTHCQVNCVKAAQELIALIHESLEQPKGISYWYSIYYLYNAATVLIAAGTFPAILQTMPTTNLNACVEKAFDSLRTYEQCTTSARRCLKALQVLQNKITTNLSMAWSESAQTPGVFAQSLEHRDDVNGIPFVDDSWTVFEGMDMFWLDNALLNQMGVAE